MSESKLVSIIIPTYKRADTLSRAIDSVLRQTYKNLEIIVVDDNNPASESRKHTEKAMEKYRNCNKVLYIKHEKNKNGSAARNTGFRHSSGQYIMFLDDDDEFMPDKVKAQVGLLDSLDNSWGACYTNYVRKLKGKIAAYGAEKRSGNLLTQELMRNLFIHAGSNLLIRRCVVDDIGGFDESFPRNQDVEFLIRILKKYKLGYIDIFGLVVNINYRTEKSIPDFICVTEQYIQKFKPIISLLPEKDQKRVYKMLHLQIFRHYISSWKIKTAAQTVIKNNIPIIDVIRYLVYLAKRFATKKAYGFDL